MKNIVQMLNIINDEIYKHKLKYFLSKKRAMNTYNLKFS